MKNACSFPTSYTSAQPVLLAPFPVHNCPNPKGDEPRPAAWFFYRNLLEEQTDPKGNPKSRRLLINEKACSFPTSYTSAQPVLLSAFPVNNCPNPKGLGEPRTTVV
jgi:hypothetical protein